VRKYSFGWSAQDSVNIPELDALWADLLAVCKKHGVGFEKEHDYDGADDIILTGFSSTAVDCLFADLDEYRGGIPWLDAAKDRFREAVESRRLTEKKLEQERASALARGHAKKLLEDGIAINGVTYRLVPEQPK
jgi:hypothetical protein